MCNVALNFILEIAHFVHSDSHEKKFSEHRSLKGREGVLSRPICICQ